MATKLIFKIRLVLILISFCFAKCNKDSSRPCLNSAYFFTATSEWTPQNRFYNVGDTLVIHSFLKKSLLNTSNGSFINYSDAVNIGGDIGFGIPDSLNMQNIPAKDSFTFISIKGRFIERINNQGQGINFEYIETDSNYVFEGKIVCNKKGYFAISVDDLKSSGIRGRNCTNASFDMTVTNTLRYQQQYERIFGITLSEASLKKIYCITVL
jgi:hypothetical protein